MSRRILAAIGVLTGLAGAPAVGQDFVDLIRNPGDGSFGQVEFLPVEEAYQVALEVAGDRQLRLYWQIAEGYYLYRKRFGFALHDGAGSIDLTAQFPTGVMHEDEYFGVSEVYYHHLDVVLDAARGSSDAVLTLTSQGCAEAGLCYPPRQQSFRLDFEHQTVAAIATTARPGARPGAGGAAPGDSSPPGTSDTLWLMLLAALVGGSLLNLMPCVFPVLSLKALSFAGAADAGQHRHGWVFAAGVVSSFLLVAVLLIILQRAGAAVGWGFQLQSPHFVALLAYLFFAMGLALSGVVELGAGFMGSGSTLAAKPGYSGSFFSGVLATVVASPCTAPFMGSALGFAVTQPPATALAIFAALGVGMAAPMLVLSYSTSLRRLLPRPGPWMETFRQLLAFPLYATAIWLLWVAGRQTDTTAMALLLCGMLALALGLWLWRYRGWGKLLATACVLGAVAVALIPPVPVATAVADDDASHFSEARLATLRAAGTPVFVNVTADWCITCLANEASTLGRESVQAAFAERAVVYLEADWTRYDSAIADFLARFQRNGIPLYLLYSGIEQQAPEILPQLLTPDIVMQALAELPQESAP